MKEKLLKIKLELNELKQQFLKENKKQDQDLLNATNEFFNKTIEYLNYTRNSILK